MKRLLFGYFVILSLLRLSYAEPLCKNDIDCVRRWAVNNRDIRYLTYGCDNYKHQSFGHSCTMLYFTLLDRIQKDIIYLCEKGNSSACFIKILYNLDSKFRNAASAAEELVEILERSERRCENKVDFMECAVASIFYTLSGNYEKAEYYLNKIKDYR